MTPGAAAYSYDHGCAVRMEGESSMAMESVKGWSSPTALILVISGAVKGESSSWLGEGAAGHWGPFYRGQRG